MAKKKLPTWATTVTTFSKMLALSMFIILPILAFLYGMYYQRQIYQQQQKIIWQSGQPHTTLPIFIHHVPRQSATQPSDGSITCTTNADCPSGYTCTQAGPIRADGQSHKTCWGNGHAVPM